MAENQTEIDVRTAPLWGGRLHRERPTFRWELPTSECGITLHPYGRLSPWATVQPPVCEVCYPPGATTGGDQ